MSPNTATTLVSTESEPNQVDCQEPIDQPTNMAEQNESVNKQNANELKLTLNLNHSIRDQLIRSLNQLAALLQYKKPIPEDAKQRICKKIDDSMRLLVDLSPVDSTPSTEALGVFEEMVFNQLIVQLTRAERSGIINHLVDIRDAVQFDNLVKDEVKGALVIENRRIINQLLDLPCREQNEKSDENVSNDEPSSKKQQGW